MISEPKNLLIVRTDRIGDVILSLPLAGIVKKNFPQCRVSYLVRSYTEELVKRNPFIDEVIILKEKNGKPTINENVKILKNKSFDSCVIVYPTFVTALIAFKAGIKKRVGSGYRWYSFLFNKKIYEHRKFAGRHELEFNVNLLRAFGIEENITPQNVNFNLQPDENSLQKVKEILAENKIDLNKKTIIVHPGSGGSAVDLPQSKMAELVNKLNSLDNLNIFLTGSQSEFEMCEKVKGGTSALNLAGKFSLPELTALISMCTLFIANSTGPIHIAAALDKFTVGFYPKILALSEGRWGPYSTKKAVFEPEINCSNCTREQCEKLDCMNSINIDTVFSKIENMLNSKEL